MIRVWLVRSKERHVVYRMHVLNLSWSETEEGTAMGHDKVHRHRLHAGETRRRKHRGL